MCMCFTPKSINFVKPSFMLNNNVIPYVENCKYLGIVIHLQSDMYDIKRQIRKFYANTNMLLRKFSICSYQVKCHLFRSYCANMYCPYFWFNKSKTCLKKLQICYNNSLRRLLRIPKRSSASEMFVNLIIIYLYKIAILHHGRQSFHIIVYCTPVYCTLVYCMVVTSRIYPA